MQAHTGKRDATRRAAVRQQRQRKRILLSEDQKNEIREAFNIFDTEGRGTIDALDVRVALRALGFDPSLEEVRGLMEAIDVGHTGSLDFSEFLELMTRKINEVDSLDDYRKAFLLFDTEGKLAISFANLQRAAQVLGDDEATHDHLKLMLLDARHWPDEGDYDYDRFRADVALNPATTIDLEQFVQVLRRKCYEPPKIPKSTIARLHGDHR